ncbi:hypothetical protein NMY22_g429 [Coprinellus aureogranulatus]|nr:hypothetical protein NMY22_g429 [Coprinellus aureogranulatus]
MFSGARDFNLGHLGIINAGRDVNINVINRGSPASSSTSTIDLRALFSGVLATAGALPVRNDELTSDTTSDGELIISEMDKGRRRGFKRMLNGVFGKLKHKLTNGSGDRGQETSFDAASLAPPIAEISTAEVYVRSLLESGNGLPCWDPRPHGQNGSAAGIAPGDVGIYTADRGFEKLYNLWDDEIGIQALAESLEGEAYRPPKRTIIQRQSGLHEGEVITRGVNTSLLQSSSGSASTGFEFSSEQSTAGAILALTSSADLEAVEDLTVLHLRECIIQHAGVLYLYANRVRRLRAEDSSLYVVTGCVKSDAWALGAFRRPFDDALKLVRSPTRGDSQQGVIPAYKWNKPGSIWADLFTGQSLEGKKDQALFLRGFKIGFSPAFRFRIANSAPSGVPIPSFRSPQENSYHPCDIINTRLLNQTGVDIALSHDDNWRLLFKGTSRSTGDNYLDLESLNFKGHGHAATQLQISIRNGVAYLESLEFAEEEDRLKQSNGQNDPRLMLSDGPQTESSDSGFNVIPDHEISFVTTSGVTGLNTVGHGTNSDFYLAIRKSDEAERRVVLKMSRVFRRHKVGKCDDATILDTTRREYAILRKLSHPNVLHLQGITMVKPMPVQCLVLDYLPLGNLPGFIRRGIPFDRLAMVKGIVQALEYIHSMRIVHGNIHPRKILVHRNPEHGTESPTSSARKGEGRASDGNELGVSTQFLASDGTADQYVSPLLYRAPELVSFSGDPETAVTYASDIFACALLIQELLTGRLSYTTKAVPAFRLSDRLLNPNSSPRPDPDSHRMLDESHNFVWPILEDCWKDDPADRISSADMYRRLCEGASRLGL